MKDDMLSRDSTVARASTMQREKIYPAEVRPNAKRVYW